MTNQIATTKKQYTPLTAQEIKDFGRNRLINDMLFSLSVVWRVTLNGETNCIADYTKKEVVSLLHKDFRPLVAATWDKEGNMKFNKNKAKDFCFDNGLVFQKTTFTEFVELMSTKQPASKVVKDKPAPKAWSDKALEGQINRVRLMDDENLIAMQKQLEKLKTLIADEVSLRATNLSAVA